MPCKFPFTYGEDTFNNCIKHPVRTQGGALFPVCPILHHHDQWLEKDEYGICNDLGCEEPKGI